jgi:hypothetical protein
MLFAGISDAFFLLLESHGFNRGRMSNKYSITNFRLVVGISRETELCCFGRPTPLLVIVQKPPKASDPRDPEVRKRELVVDYK